MLEGEGQGRAPFVVDVKGEALRAGAAKKMLGWSGTLLILAVESEGRGVCEPREGQVQGKCDGLDGSDGMGWKGMERR